MNKEPTLKPFAFTITGTGTEIKDAIKDAKNAFEALCDSNDKPYIVTFAIAIAEPKLDLNDSTVKSYLSTFQEAVAKFSNSEKLSMHLAIDSKPQAQVDAEEAINKIVAKMPKEPTFGAKLYAKVQEAHDTRAKLTQPLQDIKVAAEATASAAGLKVVKS